MVANPLGGDVVTDWNWFFSSVAQSVAALVGVLSAFLIAMLVNNQAEYARSRRRTKGLLIESDRLRQALHDRYFNWYNIRTLSKALEILAYRLKDVETLGAPEDYLPTVGLSPFMVRAKAVPKIAEAVAEEARRRRPKRSSAAFDPSAAFATSPFDLSRLRTQADVITGANADQAEQQELTREREEINRLRTEVRHHVSVIGQHLALIRGNPERSPVAKLAILAVAVLFSAGVVYPLSFLPLPQHLRLLRLADLSVSAFFQILFSFRGVLLALVWIVFTALLVGLYKMNSALVHPEEEITTLEWNLHLGNYSHYLAVAEENEGLARAEAEKEKRRLGETAGETSGATS
jgi:hypothetical protein